MRMEKDGSYRLQIENQGNLYFEGLRLVYRDRYHDLTKGLRPGEALDEVVAPESGTRLASFLVDSAEKFKKALSSRSSALGETYRLDGTLETVTAMTLTQNQRAHARISITDRQRLDGLDALFERPSTDSSWLDRAGVYERRIASIPDQSLSEGYRLENAFTHA